MEIERKFLVDRLPEHLERYDTQQLEQAYLCTDPVVRVRRQGDEYILTYKGKGHMVREEYNLPLNEQAYEHLLEKADGNVIRKRRTRIPWQSYMIELDIFEAPFEGLMLAEVEFETELEAVAFIPPEWFGRDVTFEKEYHNSTLSRKGFD